MSFIEFEDYETKSTKKKKTIIVIALIVSVLLVSCLFWYFSPRLDIEDSKVELAKTQKKIDSKQYDNSFIATMSIENYLKPTPIFNNDDDNTLYNKGIGKAKHSAKIGHGGQTIVSGHRETVFNNLDQVKIGDIVKVTTRDNKVYKYKIYKIIKIKGVGDEHKAYLTTSDDIFTFYTCYPIKAISQDTSKRIVFFAKRV